MTKTEATNPVPTRQPLRLLIVEDTPADAELMVAALKRAGYPVSFEVVDSPGVFQQRLEQTDYDLILSDHNLHTWTGMDALEMLRQSAKDIPFLLVTASLGDELAVEYLKRGAADYVLKDRPARLPTAVDRALRDKGHLAEHKKVEETLRASEERYRLLFERNLAGVIRTTLDGRILDCNDACAHTFGFASREELLAHTAWDLYLSAADREAFVSSLQKQKTLASFEVCFRRRDGKPVWVLENATLLEGEAGQPAVVEATLVDITERKQLEEQFRQSQKMEAVGRLAGGIAHDFNNLLTVIKGYSQLLHEEVSANQRLSHAASEINEAADRAASLTRQLLAFSRRQVLELRVLNLNEVVANVDKMLRRLIGEDIDLVTAPDLALGRVKADPGQVEQVLMNLAVNARDAMPQGGKLTIETANVELDETYARGHIAVQPGPYVMLAVSDTGCGMDAETQAHIFEPFFTTKERGKGTGLGLATVYGIVKQSGGYIWVYSELGRGTTLKIYLPRVEEAVEVTAEARKPLEESARGTETILLVEDEGSVRRLARECLEAQGYTMLEAKDGMEAIQIAEAYEGTIHLLLTDVVMPPISGRVLAQCLVPLRPDMKVLYISGYTDDVIVRHGVLDQGTAFLQKPFTRLALISKVREVLQEGKPAASSAQKA